LLNEKQGRWPGLYLLSFVNVVGFYAI